jgi:hypothetical protein
MGLRNRCNLAQHVHLAADQRGLRVSHRRHGILESVDVPG